MRCSHVFKSTSTVAVTTTSASATTTVTVSRDSQPESAAGQRQQGSFMGLSTTLHTPESRQIPTDYPQQAGLRLLAEVSTSQIDPFAALAAHQTVTFEDEAVTTTGIPRDPNLQTNQHLTEQSPDPTNTNKWIIVDKTQERPYRCGYPECDMSYLRKHHLTGHFIKHTGTSKFKCLYPECAGDVYFRDSATLRRHIAAKHKLEKPFECGMCDRRLSRKDHLRYHRKHIHGIEEEKKSPKRKKK